MSKAQGYTHPICMPAMPVHDLEPCGGYMVLAGLIENRIIDIRELDNRK
ncbi:MAG: hypothetical protein JRJ62_07945 [Deltaproteobacteria bacterium]|nr:hypothetical protein [Deltaproteobacteria bacterium]